MANIIDPKQRQTQHERILAWFDNHASLTRWEALTFLGIWEAPARISELRKQGYKFHTQLENGTSESGYPFQSAVWTLEKK
ncbi:helix-turn-helix domain-containing protein [Lactococcus taiwanensis]|uniref:helix-turn-helix domain-containing protein n=1 Tax=Lactococcus taiwanensis TaxID=1151742 RepID=UPI00289C88DA|nr:helix-turn-helix domain-containing protein [Lactococcus taiwanensis]